MTPLFTVLAGSRAYGLERPDSDTDAHRIYVLPTEKLLSLGPVAHRLHAHQSDEGGDHSSVVWEVGHFLSLALKCNPTVLEVFHAPVLESSTPYTDQIRALFPYVWNTRGVHDAFLGYAHSQHGRAQTDNPVRARKAMIARLRSLYQGATLLKEHRFVVNLVEEEIFPLCCAIRDENAHTDEIEYTMKYYEARIRREATISHPKSANLEVVNDLLLLMRLSYWSETNVGG